MECAMMYQFPECRFRPASGNCGCIILFSKDQGHSFFLQLTEWVSEYLAFSQCQGPSLPPSKTDLLIDQVKGWTAQSMIVMAVLGWILPILPGTPFFLVAWWLGWRPSPAETSIVAEP